MHIRTLKRRESTHDAHTATDEKSHLNHSAACWCVFLQGVSVRTREPSETTSNPACLCFPVSCFPSSSQPEPSWCLFMEPSCRHHHHHHHHLHLTYSFCNLPTDRCVTIKCARVCVWTRCDLSAGLSARACASCDSVCWQLNQRGLDEWPANHCRHSVAIAIAHRESSLWFHEAQTSHNLILKSICLLVSIWLSPALSLSLSVPLSEPFIHPTVSYCAQLVIYLILH